MAELLKGAPVAAALTEKLVLRSDALKEKGVEPCLAIVRVGERGDDLAYERAALKRCEKTGVKVKQFLLPADASKETIIETVKTVNEDRDIHGCLIFRPLPDKKMEPDVRDVLDPKKDIDCMTLTSLAGVFTCTDHGYPPCTAEAVMEILDYYGIALEGKRVTVIGRSLVIGKPVAMMLQKRNATITMCHTKTVAMDEICRNAEILVSAAGHRGTVTKDHVSPGQYVIDVGIDVGPDDKICGDVDFEEAEAIVAGITPVPGGVGSVTTAVLCKHVITAAEKTLQ